MWMARNRSFNPSATKTWSRTTESQPPERPTDRLSVGAMRVATKSPTRTSKLLDRLFLEAAIAHQPLVAGRQQFARRQTGKLLERVLQGLLQVLCHADMVTMRAAERLAYHPVDQPQGFQAMRPDTHGFRSFRCLFGTLPQNGSAAFRRNDGISGVLQHLHGIADGNRQRAAGAALADDGDDDRHFQFGHHVQITANRFGLAALLGVDTGVGTRRIDEGHDWDAELLGQLHQAQGLAIALGARHAEVAVDLFLGIATLLVAD